MHESVLFEEVMDALRPRPNVGYRALDCTLGAGGHSYGLLERSTPDGLLTGLDADQTAIERARERLAPFAGRFTLVHANFSTLSEQHIEPQDGVVFDLGLSSPQLDASGRGFSFRFEEPLDMRFDEHRQDPTAAELLNESTEAELAHVFRAYGEEPWARRLARVIVKRRASAPFSTTTDLTRAVTEALGPQRGRTHPATRVFQALRIAVNDELAALERGLDASLDLLKPGGRLAVISFQSLEDRIVKWRLRGWATAGHLDILTRKPITPSAVEQQANPRSRSAKLRVAEKTT